MKTYILLFRGINVGGNNILPMKSLASLLEENGFCNVQTYIQSGNVALQSNKKPVVAKIGSLIEREFGFKPDVMILDKGQFESAVKNNPFKSGEGKQIHFYFCNNTPNPNSEKLKNFTAKSERHRIEDKVFYLHAPDGLARSKLVANIDSCLGVSTTGRNLNTVNKLREMIKGE